MKLIIFYTVVIIILFNQHLSAQQSFLSNKLEKAWEITKGLNVVESSHYDEATKTIYTSSIVGKYYEKDSIGYISKYSENGQLITKEWVKRLNGPKGISCSKTSLYVTDIDRVLEISLKTGKILKEYRNSKTKSLNDVSVAPNGSVYVSDAEGNCVFYVGKDSLEVLLEGSELEAMNGIYAQNDLVYLGSKSNLISINPKNKELKVVAEKVGYIDGLEQISEGKFVISNFGGGVKLVVVGKGVEKLIDTEAAKINAADLGYIAGKKLLLVPTFGNNRVVAYKLNF
jgi:hypothetical protein